MKRLFALFLLALLPSVSGCAICCSPYDGHFPAYGGNWERSTADRYRVGSAFEDGGYQVTDADDEGDRDEDTRGEVPPPAVPEE